MNIYDLKFTGRENDICGVELQPIGMFTRCRVDITFHFQCHLELTTHKLQYEKACLNIEICSLILIDYITMIVFNSDT